MLVVLGVREIFFAVNFLAYLCLSVTAVFCVASSSNHCLTYQLIIENKENYTDRLMDG